MNRSETWWEVLPWDYAEKVREFIKPGVRLLDLSPPEEAFPFLSGEAAGSAHWEGTGLPFSDDSFDLVICRGGPYDPAEVARVVCKGGFFVTEQVGGMDAWRPGPPDYNLETECLRLRGAGFRLMWQHQAYPLGTGGRRRHRFIVIGKRQ